MYKYIFTIIFTIIFMILTVSYANKFKNIQLCINCKHFKKEFLDMDRYGRCALFPKNDKNIDYLIDGRIRSYFEYYFCSTARKNDSMCGLEGKKYEEK